jgi:hypothetical protein
MPFTYRIEPEKGLLVLVAEGVITQAERLATVKAWLDDPAFRPGLGTLCDFSKAESTPTLPELRAVADLIARQAGGAGRRKVAIVTAKTVTFGVARQFAALAESDAVEIQVFSDHEDACVWLQVTPSPGPPTSGL